MEFQPGIFESNEAGFGITLRQLGFLQRQQHATQGVKVYKEKRPPKEADGQEAPIKDGYQSMANTQKGVPRPLL